MAQPLTSIVTRPCTVHLLHQIGPSLIGAGIAGQRGFRLGRRALEKDGEGKNAEETDTKTTESAKPEEQKKEELLSDALSRRLASMAEDAVYENPRLARDIASGKASAEDYGFSEILKQQLQDKLESAKFNDEYAQAISASKLPSYTDASTRENALSTPWTGSESQIDASHRMLQDAYKPLRSKQTPTSTPIDLRLPRRTPSTPGLRLARARDKSLEYTISKDATPEEQDREERRRLLKERFEPTARSFGVGSIAALESLAEQRITDAIAAGAFANIPRGPASSTSAAQKEATNNPFVDTTEYFLNRIIKNQDIVPPWIEKQRELNTAIERFRAQLKADWGRMLARRFSDKGSGVEGGAKLAEQNALSEAAGHGERLPTWEKSQRGYLEVRIEELNKLARSYNLMAPELAKRPYFNLERELQRCYKEVAPNVAEIIRRRAEVDRGGGVEAEAGAGKVRSEGGKWGGHTAKVYDEGREKKFGFREFVKGLWAK